MCSWQRKRSGGTWSVNQWPPKTCWRSSRQSAPVWAASRRSTCWLRSWSALIQSAKTSTTKCTSTSLSKQLMRTWTEPKTKHPAVYFFLGSGVGCDPGSRGLVDVVSDFRIRSLSLLLKWNLTLFYIENLFFLWCESLREISETIWTMKTVWSSIKKNDKTKTCFFLM